MKFIIVLVLALILFGCLSTNAQNSPKPTKDPKESPKTDPTPKPTKDPKESPKTDPTPKPKEQRIPDGGSKSEKFYEWLPKISGFFKDLDDRNKELDQTPATVISCEIFMVVFSEHNYNGEMEFITGDIDCLTDLKTKLKGKAQEGWSWDNKIKSFIIRDGYKVVFYLDCGDKKIHKRLDGDTPILDFEASGIHFEKQ